MKSKITFIVILSIFFVSQQGIGQVWFDIAGRGGYGFSGFYNKNVWDDTEHNNGFSTGYSYGGKLGINIGEHNGVMLEANIMNGVQEFTYKANNLRTPNVTEWQTLDLNALYRFNNVGSYLELGPSMSLVRSVNQSFGGVQLDNSNAYTERYFSAMAGFGGFITGNEFFTLIMGLRLGYCLTDMLAPDAKNLPNPPPATYKTYDSYSAIQPFFAQFTVEISFGIGAIARANCGRRTYLFGSRYR